MANKGPGAYDHVSHLDQTEHGKVRHEHRSCYEATNVPLTRRATYNTKCASSFPLAMPLGSIEMSCM